MTDRGLDGVPYASALFLADRRPGTSGSVVVPVLEGHRALLVELQALVADSKIPTPRRSAQGLDSGRLALLLAVLEQRLRLSLSTLDVHTVAVGGVRVWSRPPTWRWRWRWRRQSSTSRCLPIWSPVVRWVSEASCVRSTRHLDASRRRLASGFVGRCCRHRHPRRPQEWTCCERPRLPKRSVSLAYCRPYSGRHRRRGGGWFCRSRPLWAALTEPLPASA